MAVAEDQVDDFVPLDALIQMGIAQADIKKAKEAGFHTCQSLIMYTKKVRRAAHGGGGGAVPPPPPPPLPTAGSSSSRLRSRRAGA